MFLDCDNIDLWSSIEQCYERFMDAGWTVPDLKMRTMTVDSILSSNSSQPHLYTPLLGHVLQYHSKGNATQQIEHPPLSNIF
jgi:hypothetical protein